MKKKQITFLGEEKTSQSTSEQIKSYLIKWPFFLASIILFAGLGLLLIRYSKLKYYSTASILVKTSKSQKESQDVIESALSGKQEVNINDEISLLSSSALIERTVKANNFNIRYFLKGSVVENEIYRDAPFEFIPGRIADSNKVSRYLLSDLSASGGTISIPENSKLSGQKFKWNSLIRFDKQEFVIKSLQSQFRADIKYVIQREPVTLTGKTILDNLTIKPLDEKTNVITLSLLSENLQSGIDILNALYHEFTELDKEDRQSLSLTTVQFIDDRLLLISKELKGVEGDQEAFQRNSTLVDIKGQSSQSLENSNEVGKSIKDLEIQKRIVNMIIKYFNSQDLKTKLVPSALGLNDATLNLLISQYNELQLRKERESPMLAPNSTVLQDINTQLSSVKQSILESLGNLNDNLALRSSKFQNEQSQYRSILSSVPHNERVLQEIKRKQAITEGLYLYLLQKREEAAISSTATNVDNYRLIDPANGFGPVEPKKLNILIYSTMLGVFLPLGFFYLKNQLNSKITSKEEVASIVDLQIVGQLSHVPKRKESVINLLGKSITGEQLRLIRTNLNFLLNRNDAKIILVTSSNSGEGKTFISSGLAKIFATPGKKVALLEFDIRKPGLSPGTDMENAKGLSNYLSEEVENLSEVAFVDPAYPNLHIYPAGKVNANAADLLLSKRMQCLFDELQNQFDFILIDSSPAGLVTDAFIIGKFSHAVLFIVRNQVTEKSQLESLSTYVRNGQLNNVYIVYNDDKKSAIYDYGYGN